MKTKTYIDAVGELNEELRKVREFNAELLAALKAALPMIDTYKAHSGMVCDQIRAAIAKATNN
jgi:ATP phosphoribosyltransferase regulatory subunit HisZ